ncbi:C6 zinc finger protein [Acephala macrosclerotiorum]|nr:C6 zinc finger protein [Acephala macrosclerotiorum]
MVFKGRPSRGCELCRKVHTKCDEKRPACSRCVRLKRDCSGYRDEIDLIFHHTDVELKGRRRKSGKDDGKQPSAAMGSHSSHDHCKMLAGEVSFLLSGSGQTLLPSKEHLALCFFYQTTLEPLVDADHTQYLHLQLPTLFSLSREDSALHLATQAISLAVWARSRPSDINARRLSRIRYSQSLSAMKAAIQDPVEVKSDETLYTVLLLSGYETITFDSEALSAWGTHIDGATALIRNRGRKNFFTPFACNMFLFIRRSAIQSHSQISRPMDPIFDDFAEILSPYENVEDQLLSRTTRIPELQALTNSLLSRPSCDIDVSEAFELIQAAEDVDCELARWARQIPTQWSYTTVTRMSPRLSKSFFIPIQIHRYPNFYAARVWNLYRVHRLIIQSILFRVSSCTYLDRTDYHQDRTEKINRNLVDDMCASVPFLLGYDLSKLKHSADSPQDENFTWPQSSINKASSSGHTGRFSLIWPLYFACSVPSVPEIQREWMRAQLRWIAETGEAQARFVQNAESQTLIGGPENFRFDCV